jgi:DNA-binding HxlR family transcriptional regulator
MRLLDLLGRRWTLRVLWELHGEDPLTFRALREACGGISPTVLNTRLSELHDAGIVDKTDTGYALSPQGRALSDLLVPLDTWARRWAR